MAAAGGRVVAVAAVVNALLFADLIRCSGAVPAALYIAFAVGARTRETGRGWGWDRASVWSITIGGLLAQWRGDAALNVDASFLPFGIGLAAGLLGRRHRLVAGRLAGSAAGRPARTEARPRDRADGRWSAPVLAPTTVRGRQCEHRRQHGEERAWPSR